MAHISQREARKLRKRVEELEYVINQQRRVYAGDWPGGVNICTVELNQLPGHLAAIKTARMLGHGVVAMNSGTSLLFYALPLPRVSA